MSPRGFGYMDNYIQSISGTMPWDIASISPVTESRLSLEIFGSFSNYRPENSACLAKMMESVRIQSCLSPCLPCVGTRGLSPLLRTSFLAAGHPSDVASTSQVPATGRSSAFVAAVETRDLTGPIRPVELLAWPVSADAVATLDADNAG